MPTSSQLQGQARMNRCFSKFLQCVETLGDASALHTVLSSSKAPEEHAARILSKFSPSTLEKYLSCSGFPPSRYGTHARRTDSAELGRIAVHRAHRPEGPPLICKDSGMAGTRRVHGIPCHRLLWAQQHLQGQKGILSAAPSTRATPAQHRA